VKRHTALKIGTMDKSYRILFHEICYPVEWLKDVTFLSERTNFVD